MDQTDFMETTTPYPGRVDIEKSNLRINKNRDVYFSNRLCNGTDSTLKRTINHDHKERVSFEFYKRRDFPL